MYKGSIEFSSCNTSDQLLLCIEKTRYCVRQLEEHTKTIGHSDSGSLSGASGTNLSQSITGDEDREPVSQCGVEGHNWDGQDIEVNT